VVVCNKYHKPIDIESEDSVTEFVIDLTAGLIALGVFGLMYMALFLLITWFFKGVK
jgi:hypothetical protein